MKCRLFLDIIIRKGTAILKLLSGKDKTLLVGRDALLVLYLGLYIVDGIARLHLQGDSLTRHCWSGQYVVWNGGGEVVTLEAGSTYES